MLQSGESGTIRESNQTSGVRKTRYPQYYVRKSSILFAGTGVRKNSTVASGSSPIKINYFYYFWRFIFRINEVMIFQ